ncbi:CLUMA_CG010558, isoform A [Clunio marinus]|uniref:CLUMA_CG010558, isoform A n=1 Tax=Clunio marinus TaxID=568069 RepID=A0A1J1IFC9_9DIPT|nr:CLUMA_CG010558, isoform A [Clunio marinus]
MSSASFQCIEDPFHVLPTKPNKCCPRPSKCDPCGGSCMPICGTLNPNLTCRPGGRAWGRACGPVCLENNQWKQPTLKLKNCKPIKIRGRKSCSLPYGFGLYARKLYPYGIPCKGTFCLPMPSCDQCFYPSLPTKPAKVYSTYTFNVRGPPYTCPRPCISC